MIGSGVSAYTYDWVGEQWLATWLAEERVVEAILGESCQVVDTAGATATVAAKSGEGSKGGKNKLDRQVCSTSNTATSAGFSRICFRR